MTEPLKMRLSERLSLNPRDCLPFSTLQDLCHDNTHWHWEAYCKFFFLPNTTELNDLVSRWDTLSAITLHFSCSYIITLFLDTSIVHPLTLWTSRFENVQLHTQNYKICCTNTSSRQYRYYNFNSSQEIHEKGPTPYTESSFPLTAVGKQATPESSE